jgi:YegS/Rv2252/BmrU family lipid kinase
MAMSAQEWKVIVNPAAACGAVYREWPQMRSFLQQQGLRFRDVYTEAPGHAVELARQALAEGYPTVVAVGGDGTVNEVVNGLVAEEPGPCRPTATLAIISRGTGCDLGRSLGLADVRRALRSLLAPKGKLCIDVGEVTLQGWSRRPEKRLFVNVAGLGFDGEVVEGLLARENAGKELGGTIPYLAQVVRTILGYRNKRVRLRVDGEEPASGVFTGIFVANGRFLAGGMRIAPKASLTDGLFDLVLIRKLSRLGLLLRLPTVYFGWHEIFPQVRMRKARSLEVQAEERLLIQADGELLGLAPATFRILPQALQVLV